MIIEVVFSYDKELDNSNEKKIYKFYNHSKSGNYIVAAAIGNKAINEWKSYAFKTWMSYCKKNDIGLLVFEDYIIKKRSFLKIATWQKIFFQNIF